MSHFRSGRSRKVISFFSSWNLSPPQQIKLVRYHNSTPPHYPFTEPFIWASSIHFNPYLIRIHILFGVSLLISWFSPIPRTNFACIDYKRLFHIVFFSSTFQCLNPNCSMNPYFFSLLIAFLFSSVAALCSYLECFLLHPDRPNRQKH